MTINLDCGCKYWIQGVSVLWDKELEGIEYKCPRTLHTDTFLFPLAAIPREYKPSRIKELRASKPVTTRERQRKQILALLGDRCLRCGFDDPRALQIDHVHGGGVKELRESKGKHYRNVLKALAAGTDRYQLLCANCNWIKRHENDETASHRYRERRAA